MRTLSARIACAILSAALALDAGGGEKGGAKGGIDKKTEAAIDAAVLKGRAWLKTELSKELGENRPALYNVTRPHGKFDFKFTEGRLALLALALVESGEDPAEPVLRRAWDRVRAAPAATTYDAGVSLLFAEGYLRACHGGKRTGSLDPAVRAWMQKTADYLASGCYGGSWTYTCPGGYALVEDPKKPYGIGEPGSEEEAEDDALLQAVRDSIARRGHGDFDHSNGQYAVLGLKAASLCGVKVKNARLMWRMVIFHILRTQEADGPEVDLQLTREESRFKVTDYSTEAGPSKPRARGWSYARSPVAYGTMTAAGMAALLVAQSEVPDLNAAERVRVTVSARDALAWLQKHWSVEENPLAAQGMAFAKASHYYHLYGLERVGMLTAVRALAGHPWYKEGAEVILRQQLPNGSWTSRPEALPEEARIRTAFALLFLSRSTREDYAVGEGAGK